MICSAGGAADFADTAARGSDESSSENNEEEDGFGCTIVDGDGLDDVVGNGSASSVSLNKEAPLVFLVAPPVFVDVDVDDDVKVGSGASSSENSDDDADHGFV